MNIDINTINRLKVAYHERWEPEQYKFMTLEIHTGAVVFTNDLDCDGSAYFCYKSFPRTIKKWEAKVNDLYIIHKDAL